MTLSNLLTDLADEARVYANGEAALAGARRRRRIRVAAPLCAAGLAAALVAGASLAPGAPDGGAGEPPDRRGLFAQYPERVTVPADADPLPEGRRVGLASFVYAPCPRGDCPYYLVMPDGTQYRLPQAIDGGPIRDVTLSPDGRYLGWGFVNETWYTVRDLLTGREVIRAGQEVGSQRVSAWVWSPNSTLLLLAEHRDGAVRSYLVADMHGAGVLTLGDAGSGSVVGIGDDLHLILWTEQSVRVLGPDGNLVRDATLARSDLMREGEQLFQVLVSPCSCLMYLAVAVPGASRRPRALLGMDIDGERAGQVTSRLDLPRSTEAGAIGQGVWTVRASLAGGIVLVRSSAMGTDVEVLNDVTGRRTIVSTLPANVRIYVRGQPGYPGVEQGYAWVVPSIN